MKRNFDFDKLRGMDIFFSNGRSPHNFVVRLACGAVDGVGAALRGWRSRSMADHAGYLTTRHGQFFPTELTPSGIREGTMEAYRGRAPRIVAVYRWAGFDVRDLRTVGEQHLAVMVRHHMERGIGYDWWGAIRSSWLGRRLLPFAKDSAGRNYCSENVLEVLSAFGCPGPYPAMDNPEELRRWMASRPDFALVKGFLV